MRLSFLTILPLVGLACATTLACSSAPPPDEAAEEPGRASSAIINGQLDTTHPAVVALILQQGSQGGLCSGTIVKVDAERHIGWVATAAHCVDVAPAIVVQAEDILSPDAIRYEVIDFKADPRYTGQTSANYDFAMLRIAGVDGSTPTIPLVSSPDGLAQSTPVTSVGFGRTTLIQSGATDENTKRRVVNRSLSVVQTAQIAYNMSQAGICQGDSGGPVLAQSGGSERVVGIHSWVEGDCNGRGWSGRTTAGLGFFNGELNKALPTEDCALCEKIANSGNSECAALSKSCLADKDCKGYYECLAGGSNRATCFEKFPKAEGPFNAAANCTCTRACADKCGDTLTCKNTPKCGYKFPAGDCTTCTEGACCQEAIDCASDGLCYVCLKQKDKDPACADNAARKKLATCVAAKCGTECAGSGLEVGAEPLPEEGGGGGGGDTTTTTTESGCAATPKRPTGGLGAAVGLALALLARRRRR